MSTNSRFMPVSPEDVWEVLADPGEYGYWVVGSKVIREADRDWPAPGARFHHRVGWGPLNLDDYTECLEADPPHRLKLRANGRPLGTASVTLEMTPRDGGTVVRMTENPDGIFRPLGLMLPLQVFSLGRNTEALMRLEDLALRKAARR